jgi:AcrR family transcriptional regulator
MNDYSPAVYSADTIAWARQAYVDGAPVADILAHTGMTRGTFYYWLHGGPNDGGGPKLSPIPNRREAMPKKRIALKSRRALLVARIWRAAEKQVRDIEKRMARSGHQPDERERDARLLAVLVKTLRELAAIDPPPAGRAGKSDSGSEDDEHPRDLEEFRRELARRMDAVAGQRTTGGADEPDAP